MGDDSEDYYNPYRRSDVRQGYEREYASQRRPVVSQTSREEEKRASNRREQTRGWLIALIIVAVVAIFIILGVLGVAIWNAHQQVKSPPNGPCKTGAQCPAGYICAGTTCKGQPNAPCTTTDECYGVATCVGGKCLAA